MGHLQNIQPFETRMGNGNLQSYDEQSIQNRQIQLQFPSYKSKKGEQPLGLVFL